MGIIQLFKNMIKNKDYLKKHFLLIGTFFVFLMTSILIISTISFSLGYAISPILFFIAFLLNVITLILFIRRYFKSTFSFSLFIVISIIIIVLLVSLFTAGYFYDVSYDGRLYHQYTISHLATGWNPFYSPSNQNGFSKEYGQMKKSVWSTIYPRAMEICAANIYSITGKIEDGKMFNILLIFSAFFISFAVLLSITNFSLSMNFLFSFLLAFNPVSIATMFSYYVDGMLSSLLIGFFSITLLGFKEKKYIYILILAPYTILLINTKFTGLAYAFFIISGVLIGFLIKKSFLLFFKSSLTFLIAGIIGFFLIGFSPYITNYIKYGHPLHPIMGKHKMKGLMKQKFLAIPNNLRDKNRFEKFFISILSKSEFIQYPNSTRYKTPFSVTKEEISNFKSTHVRVGGWGPLFGGIFILIIILLPVILFSYKRQSLNYFLFLGLIILSIIVNREFWYARFAPQVWLIPFVFLTLLLSNKKKIIKNIARTIILLLSINSLLIFCGYFSYQIDSSVKLHNNLHKIAIRNKTVELYTPFKSTRIMFYEANIKYKLVKKISKNKRIIDLGHGIKIGS